MRQLANYLVVNPKIASFLTDYFKLQDEYDEINDKYNTICGRLKEKIKVKRKIRKLTREFRKSK